MQLKSIPATRPPLFAPRTPRVSPSDCNYLFMRDLFARPIRRVSIDPVSSALSLLPSPESSSSLSFSRARKSLGWPGPLPFPPGGISETRVAESNDPVALCTRERACARARICERGKMLSVFFSGCFDYSRLRRVTACRTKNALSSNRKISGGSLVARRRFAILVFSFFCHFCLFSAVGRGRAGRTITTAVNSRETRICSSRLTLNARNDENGAPIARQREQIFIVFL